MFLRNSLQDDVPAKNESLGSYGGAEAFTGTVHAKASTPS